MNNTMQEAIKSSPTVHKIRLAHLYDESLGFVVYAPRGFGKSSWSFQVGARCTGTTLEPDYERLKKWIIFTPMEFCDMVSKVKDHQIILIWDDAGYWLNRLFWYDRFVREALRYMTLQRTQFSCIIFSTPSLSLLPNKILELEDVYRVKIYKLATDSRTPCSRPRLAWVKRPWYSDDQSKHGVGTAWREKFNAIMPDSFFEWYQPLRRRYTVLAARRISEAINSAKGDAIKMKLEALEEDMGKTVPDPDQVQDMAEVVAQLKT